MPRRHYLLEALDKRLGSVETLGLNDYNRTIQQHVAGGARELNNLNKRDDTKAGPFGQSYITDKRQSRNQSLVAQDRMKDTSQSDYSIPGSVDPRVKSGYSDEMDGVTDEIAARVPDYGKEFVSKLVRDANAGITDHMKAVQQANTDPNLPTSDDHRRWIKPLPDDIHELDDEGLEAIHSEYNVLPSIQLQKQHGMELGGNPEDLEHKYQSITRAVNQLKAVNAEYDRRYPDLIPSKQTVNIPKDFASVNQFSPQKTASISSMVGANTVSTFANLTSPEYVDDIIPYISNSELSHTISSTGMMPPRADINIVVNNEVNNTARKGGRKVGVSIAREAARQWNEMLRNIPPNTILSGSPNNADTSFRKRSNLFTKAGFGPVYAGSQFAYWDGQKLSPIELNDQYVMDNMEGDYVW